MLITDGRIQPQLAMKILLSFDKAVADVLSDKVKSRLTFKVGFTTDTCIRALGLMCHSRVTSIPTVSATTCGHSSSRISISSSIILTKSMPTGSRLSAAMQSVRVKLRTCFNTLLEACKFHT